MGEIWNPSSLPSFLPSCLPFLFYIFAIALKTLGSVTIPLNLVYSVSRYIIKPCNLGWIKHRNAPLLCVDNIFYFLISPVDWKGLITFVMIHVSPIFKLNCKLHLDFNSLFFHY